MTRRRKTRSRAAVPGLPALLRAIALCCCLGVLFCGCGSEDGSKTGDTLTDPAQTSEDPQFQADDSLIEELYGESGSYTDSFGTAYDYDWQIPQIRSDSEDAQDLNRYFANYFGAYVQTEKAHMQAKESLQYTKVTWERYWHGSRLFLKLTADSGSERDMDAVCFDFASGKRVDNRELLSELGISEDAYLKMLRKAVLQIFDSRYTDHMKRREFYDGGGQGLRAHAISPQLLNVDRPLYIGEQEELTAIVPIVSVAGAAWYFEEIPLKPEQNAGKDLHAEDSFVQADLADGVLTVTFHENEDAKYLFGSLKESPEFGKAYTVDGLYGDYQQLLAANLGNSVSPYLFLLTEDGRVEFVDLTDGIRCGYYCSGGVLPKTTNVQRIEAKTVFEGGGAYQTVAAVNAKGKEKDLTAYVFAAQNAIESSLTDRSWHVQVTHTLDGGGSYTEDYWAEFRDDHSLILDSAAAEGTINSRYSGSYDYLGMTEDGLIVNWNAREKGKNKTHYQGVWSLELSSLESESLIIERKAGDNFFDAEDGGCTYLEPSAG